MKLKAIAQTVSLSALGLALAIPAQAAFFEDSKASLELRNFYFNRDFRHDTATQSKAEEWAQGFLFRYESGFTEGTVGVGIDAMGFAGFKLDSGRGRVGSGLLPKHDDGRAASSYGELGATFKAKLSESVLKAGTLRPNLPTVSATDTRLLPTTFTGVHVNSKEIKGLNVDLGRLGRVNHQASTNNEGMTANAPGGKSSSKFDFGNLSYNWADYGLNAGYSYGKLHDVYKQHIFNGGHTWNITDGQSLRTDLRYARTKDSGSYTGKLDNKAAGAMLTYALGYNKFGLAYQKMSGDDGYVFLDGTNPYLVNYVQVLNFGRKDEKSWQARYDYNFEGLGIPGLSLMTRYLRGTDFKTANKSNAKEWERDTDIVYSFQDGTLKGLRLHWRNATVRSDALGKIDENRLIVSYTIPLM